MRVPRLLTAGLALAALSALPAAPVRAAAPEYVALGDSYSSGTGAGSYTDVACTRSANAYPALWAAAHPGTTFRFVACGGAVIPDVRRNQLSALTATTTRVTISIGGNDAGFASTMLSCQYLSTTACRAALNDGLDYIENDLPGELATLYAEIRARAPRAGVVVVGYPHLYKDGGLCLGGLSSTKRDLINQGSDVLTGVLETAARAAGFAFADARPAFAGHEICTTSPWIDSSTVHPNATGHRQAYLPAVSAV